MSAICGKSCSITVGGSDYAAHQFSISRQANEIDVTSFESGTYGEWIACSQNATISAQLYDLPGSLNPGDEADVVVSFGYDPAVTVTYSDCVVTALNSEVDAKGLVSHNITLRIVGDPTIGS